MNWIIFICLLIGAAAAGANHIAIKNMQQTSVDWMGKNKPRGYYAEMRQMRQGVRIRAGIALAATALAGGTLAMKLGWL